MNVLVACEFSGVVRDAFRAKGHSAWSCDLLPAESKPHLHIQGDALEAIRDGRPTDGAPWDMMICHPPCTHLAVSGARWFKDKAQEQAEALEFARSLMNAPIPRIALENPVSIISTRIRKPDQVIQPWMFGHEAQKTTCLWLKGLPKLEPTQIVGKGEFTVFKSGKRHPKWYADAFKHGEHGHLRSRTFSGIAQAMADQWGSL